MIVRAYERVCLGRNGRHPVRVYSANRCECAGSEARVNGLCINSCMHSHSIFSPQIISPAQPVGGPPLPSAAADSSAVDRQKPVRITSHHLVRSGSNRGNIANNICMHSFSHCRSGVGYPFASYPSWGGELSSS